MSEIMEDISYLSQEIGPRPAGTEEEQQAALYIADQMQKRTGFTANIEDFNTQTQPGLVEAICFGVSALISFLAIIFGALVIPAFLITLACAVLYAFELIDRPLLSHAFERGVSQNIVMRYKPGSRAQERGRKIVLVANYDSSKVQSELNGALFGIYPVVLKVSTIALVLLPFIWLIHALSGAAAFFNLLAGLALVLALVPVAIFFMHKASTYNEAANNNAAGVATLLRVARSIADGTLSEEEIAATHEAHIHGADEAFAAGVVPEGAELAYAEGLEASDEDRLASAKAAVAALTGQPLREYKVEHIDFTPLAQREDIDSYSEEMDYGEYAYPEDDELTEVLPPVVDAYSPNPVTHRAPEDYAVPTPALEANAEEADAEEGPATDVAPIAPATVPDAPAAEASASNEPSWYTTGRAKAVKPEGADNVVVRRSRYADALDAAVASSKAHFDEAARMLSEGTIERISQMQRDIEAKKTASGMSYGAPLQDVLSDENGLKEAPVSAPAEEATAAATGQAAVPEEFAPSAPISEAADEGAKPSETFEAPEAPEVSATSDVSVPAPVSAPDISDKTIGMPPIDVTGLAAAQSAEEENTAPSEGEPHDFSKIEAPARRYREEYTPVLPEETDDAESAPARYSNPLQSERIPRIVAEEKPAVSVMQDFPVTSGDETSEAPETPSTEERRAALRNAIPSLSGEFAPIVVTEASEEENTEVSKTGSFATAASASAFEPVGDELVAELAPEERYVDDADDSAFDEETTETGAYAGPGYVDMPESRLGRFFSRFRKKNTEEETTTNEWLDVDDSFDAREVGAARGSWESFRTDAAPEEAPAAGAPRITEDELPGLFDTSDATTEAPEDEEVASFDEYEYVDVDEEDGRSWHGGAFSQMRAKLLGNAEADEAAAELIEDANDARAATDAADAPVVERTSSVSVPLVDTTEDTRIAEEAKMIYSFRNPDINTEVWFVALGAEYAGNSGMKAFLAEHASELRGAIIVNMEAMGAGSLSFIEEEGLLLTQKPSSRLKRFLHKAADVSGVHLSSGRIAWRESAASLAMKRGLQAMTVAGMAGAKPAFLGQGDDVLENISEQTVEENAQFMLEFIKGI